MTENYKEAFTVPDGTAFWRGKLNFRTTKSKHLGDLFYDYIVLYFNICIHSLRVSKATVRDS